ncbi:MAG: hypothetical protein ACOH2M_21480 [Cypionkella sp.]
MKRTKNALLLSAALMFSAGIVQAAPITLQDVVTTYQDATFTSVEIVETATQIKVEAIQDGMKLEIVYDKATGDVVKREQRPASAKDGDKSGVSVSSDDSSSDDDDDDEGSDDDSSSHDGSGGSDDGEGHDSGDDHGSDHGGGSGSDHDSNDN